MQFDADEEAIQKAKVTKLLESLNKLVRIQDAVIALINADTSCPSELREEFELALFDCPGVISHIMANHTDVIQIIRTDVHKLIEYTLNGIPGQVIKKDGVHVLKENE